MNNGFKVVAVDANPQAVENGIKRFPSYIESGQLVLLNVGIADFVESGRCNLDFYVNEVYPHWSSFSKNLACREGHGYHVVNVPCNSLFEIVKKYGTPYYIKIDIECYDFVALKGIEDLSVKPQYVSVENGNAIMLNFLIENGYNKFKYINQQCVCEVQLPVPPLEGIYCEHRFAFGSSGPFGEETVGHWKDEKIIKVDIGKVYDLVTCNKNPDHVDSTDGWFDLHAKLA